MILQNISAPTALNLVDFDPEYSIGARNAVRVCLNIQPSEKVTVITDAVTREIAADLNVSVKTVATHRARLLAKLGLKNNAEIVQYAIENELLPRRA